MRWIRSPCFNSSVGILVVRTRGVVPGLPLEGVRVSIPRSEFWSFGLLRSTRIIRKFQFLGRNSGRSDKNSCTGPILVAGSFNSSVGILVVRTQTTVNEGGFVEFQFLGRNSGRSDRRPHGTSEFQFLGRNSGRSDTSATARPPEVIQFQFLGRNSGRSDDDAGHGSSVDKEA